MSLTSTAAIFSCAVFLLCNASAEERRDVSLSGVSGANREVGISEGIRIVLSDSRLLKISLAELDVAKAEVLLARSVLLPQVNASMTESLLNHEPTAKLGPVKVATAQRDSFSYGFDVYQTLFDFGKSLSVYRASQELVNAGKANIAAVKKVAVLEFIIAYFNLLESEKMSAVAAQEVEGLASYARDVELLYEQGAAVRTDTLPAKVKLADARQKLIAARNRRTRCVAQLNSILALPLREDISVCDIAMDDPQVPVLETAWETARQQRCELAVVNDQIQSSLFSEKARAKENYPVVYADGGYSYTQNRYQEYEGNAFLNFGAKAALYDGGAGRSLVFKERALQALLNRQKEKLIDDIRVEVEDSYLSLKDAREKVSVAREAVSQAEENVRANRVKYAEGSATTTDVLEAITLETGARTNYYSALYELKRGYAKLMYSMGIDLALVYDKMDAAYEHKQQ